MAYITLQDIRQYIKMQTSTDDALLQSLITAAQDQIERRCRRTFESLADETRYYTADNLMLPPIDARPSQSVSWDSVYGYYRRGVLDVDDDLISVTTLLNGDGSTITSSQYWLLPLNTTPKSGIQLLSTVDWVLGLDTLITLTGRFGYSLTAPDDIQLACKELVSYWYKNKDSQVFDVIQTPDGAIMSPKGWPLTVQMILINGNYIRPLGVI